MSLSPIQIYQQQQNPLAQILAGGNQTITGIFDRAIQIGRDMSNKQLQQEQDMMAMRKFETSMMERRAENLQQNNEDAIKFARSAFESDRKFGVDVTQQAFQNQRATANDLFSQQTDTARLNIAREGLDIRKEDQQIQRDSVEAERAARAAERAGVQKILGGGSSSSSVTKEQYLASGGNPLFMGAIPDGTSSPDKVDPNKRLGEIDAALASKTLTLEQDAQLRGEKNALESQIKQSGAGGTGSPYAAKDQAMQEKAFADSQAAKADKAMEEKVLGNTSAFIPQETTIAKRQAAAAAATATGKPIPQIPEDQTAEAKAYDKDRYISEKASARRMTLPEYLAKGPQDEASKKAREELWNYVNTGADPQAGADATKDLIEGL
jgi:hypothetical protein